MASITPSGLVLAFAGQLGSHRSEISERVAQKLEWPRASFGNLVESYARDLGVDPNDIPALQKLGQDLVQTDVEGFVKRLIESVNFERGEDLVVDGLRHAEVRLALSRQVDPSRLRTIYLSVPTEDRLATAAQRYSLDERVILRYDQDLTEAQLFRIIPAYADFHIDGTDPISLSVKKVLDYIEGIAPQSRMRT